MTAATVRPALVLPIPVVNTERGVIFVAYFRNCDLPVPEMKSNKELLIPLGLMVK